MKTLTKYHDALFCTVAGDPKVITISTAAVSNGWEQITPGYLLSENYFDLAGLSLDDKTTFIEGITVQEGGIPAIAGAPGDSYVLFDIMTSIPIDFTADSFRMLGQLAVRGVGFPGTTLNFEHVLYSRYRRWSITQDTAGRSAVLINDSQSGSAAATASDRIYCYRIVAPFLAAPSQITNFNVQSARYLINAKPVEEMEFKYLMRLKKSYDLQNEPDVD